MLAADPALPLTSIRTRNDLLRQYWDQRVVGARDRHGRRATLTVLATQMITDRRPRVADPAATLDAALHGALEGLLADDVLREDPRDPWAAAAATGFSHPILFDYAAAQLVLVGRLVLLTGEQDLVGLPGNAATLAGAVRRPHGWQFVVEELQRAGITALLAEPAEIAHLRGPKRHAKTDKTDSRHLRMLVADGRVPLS